MKKAAVVLFSVSALAWSLPAAAHEHPTIPHEHVTKQTSYGVQRQGHAVNNQLGNIVIYSPQPVTGYQSGQQVQFAKPQMPGVGAVAAPSAPKRANNPTKNYGKPKKSNQ